MDTPDAVAEHVLGLVQDNSATKMRVRTARRASVICRRLSLLRCPPFNLFVAADRRQHRKGSFSAQIK
jgi:hypothetical protein